MYAAERQQAMADLIAQRGRLSVSDLAEVYDVTTETVRRDLSLLERAGLVRRVHGGAVPAHALTMLETALNDRDLANTDQKDHIAKVALQFLPQNGGSVLIDAGTTTARLAAHLPRGQNLTVFTNAVPIAGRLAEFSNVELHLLPGRVRRTTQAAVGDETVTALAMLRTDVAFVGANGVTVAHGLSTPDPSEAAVKRAMTRTGQRVVALADSSKIGREHTVRFADLSAVDVLVTDAGVEDRDVTALEAEGLEVVIA